MQSERLKSTMSQDIATKPKEDLDSGDDEALTIPEKSLVEDLFPVKDPRLCKLRTLSTDRLQTLFQFGHQRRLSGETLVELEYKQPKTPSSLIESTEQSLTTLSETDLRLDILTILPFYCPELGEPEQWEDNEVELFKELPFYGTILEDSEEERIIAENDAKWKKLFKLQGKKHYEHTLEIYEEHDDTLKQVHKRFVGLDKQSQRFKDQRDTVAVELKATKQQRDELKEKLDENVANDDHNIDTYSNENVALREEITRLRGIGVYMQDLALQKVLVLEYQLQEQDNVTTAVFQQNTDLQNELAEVSEEKDFLWANRASDREASLLQIGQLRDELSEASAQNEFLWANRAEDRVAFENVLEQIDELKSELVVADVENDALRADLVTAKEASDAIYRQLQSVTAAQDQQPAQTAEDQKALDETSKQYSDLEKRAAASFTALRKEQIQNRLDRDSSSKTIKQLTVELEQERNVSELLRLSHEEYKRANEGSSRMLQEHEVNEHVQRLTDEVAILHQMLTERDLADGVATEETDPESQDTLLEDLTAVTQQRDMQTQSINDLIHLPLQLFTRMQSLDTQLRSQGLDMYNDQRAALMSYCCQTLQPLGADVSNLIADDEAKEEAAAAAATPKPITGVSENWLQENADAEPEDSYLKQAAAEGSETARALLAKAAVSKQQANETAEKQHTKALVESPRDRMLREAAEDPSLLLNHDSQGTAI